MNTAGSWRDRLPKGIAVGVIAFLAVAVLPPEAGTAQTTSEVRTCKKLEFRPHGGGSELVSSQCGNQFTTRDAYIGLVIQLRNVRDQVRLDVELQDPDQASVWTRQAQINPPAPATDSFYELLWMFAVLPIAADPTALAREDVRLAFSVIRIQGGKPVSERLGEWTLRVRQDRGAPITLKFTLQQPPG